MFDSLNLAHRHADELRDAMQRSRTKKRRVRRPTVHRTPQTHN